MTDRAEMIGKVRGYLRRNGVQIALEALFNFILPFVVYSLAKHRLGDVGALLASSAPPIVWSLVVLARKRRVDALSMLVLAGIALSLLAFVGGGSPRLLLLREKLVTALIGLVFLGSAAIGRPLIYQLARATMRRRSDSEAEAFEAMRDNVHFRRAMTIMTLAWGFGLVAEASAAGVLVFTLSIRDYLVMGPIMGYGATGALSLWTFLYARRRQRIGAARRAAEEAAGPETANRAVGPSE
ncbi:MAG: VC0807 family protein [Caulobacteraceae bacterium]